MNVWSDCTGQAQLSELNQNPRTHYFSFFKHCPEGTTTWPSHSSRQHRLGIFASFLRSGLDLETFFTILSSETNPVQAEAFSFWPKWRTRNKIILTVDIGFLGLKSEMPVRYSVKYCFHLFLCHSYLSVGLHRPCALQIWFHFIWALTFGFCRE